MNPNKKKKQPNKWLVFLNIPFQMGIIIFLGVSFGKYLDSYFKSDPVFIIILSITSVFISLYTIFKTLKKIQDND
jgi:F0F1-type ATP synthase assembly protein I